MLTIEVPVRDGTLLRGLRYAADGERAPVVLTLTPYGADRFHLDGKRFAARGFHFVSLDVRGRGDSDGTFVPFVADGPDGHDVVEWLAAQAWSDGRVVMYGGSYGGFAQWVTAATKPEGLAAIVPVASVWPGVDFPFVRNVPCAHAVRWLAFVDGRRTNHGPYQDEEHWRKAARELARAGRPFRDLDLQALGRRLPVFQEWLDHPEPDDYWAAPRFDGIDIPVMTITGQYDDDQLGALRYCETHEHQIVIGPWDHAATRTGAREFYGLKFHESAEMDMVALHADWYDWVLGRGGKPEFLRGRVVYFHEDGWRSSAELPRGNGELRLQLPAAELALDPRKPPDAPQMYTAESLDGGFVHVTRPVGDAVDVTGRPRAHLVLSSELEDFDLMVRVYLLPAGKTARFVGECVVRAGYRDSLERHSPWPQGVEVPVELTDFPFVSFRADRADRFAVVIGTPHLEYGQNLLGDGTVALCRGSYVAMSSTPAAVGAARD